MLIYDLEKRGKYTLYEYLYICIREDILSGRLQAGEKLPSKREMAESHAVAVITVENAYAQLMIEGYLVSRERSGYFVNPEILTVQGGDFAKLHSGKEQEKTSVAHKEGRQEVENCFDKEKQGQHVISGINLSSGAEKAEEESSWLVDFTGNTASGKQFPFATWTKLLRRVLNEHEADFGRKPEMRGEYELRRAVADYLGRAKGLEIAAGRVVIGPGTEFLHHIILQLIGHSRIVAVEDPGYKNVGLLYESNGLRCLPIPVDKDGLMVSALKETNAGLLHISPSHHFPTGCVLPAGRRYELLEWARGQEAYIIEDDYDSEFRFDGRPVPTLAAMDRERVIYMNTFTKTLAPSIRIAYMVLPEKLNRRLEERLKFYSGAVSSFEQYTLAAFIREGYYERHISRMKNYYRQQRAKLLKCLSESELWKYVEIEEKNAGLHFILSVQMKIDDDKFRDFLENKKIRLAPLSHFCYNKVKKYHHKFIISYADIPQEKLQYVFDAMYEAARFAQIG